MQRRVTNKHPKTGACAVPDEPERASVIASLRAGLTNQGLTAAGQRHARQLIDRLQTRVQVVLLGPESVGKSQLRQVLLQEISTQHASTQFSLDAATAPAFAGVQVIQSNAALLRDIDLVDLSGFDVGGTAKTSAFASADVVLWCTQDFDAQEAEVWAAAPDHLKDHSFLVLTKADTLSEDNLLQTQMRRLAEVAADEFHSFLPTSTAAAIKDLVHTGQVPDVGLAASGIKALSAALTKLAADGRQADLDAALLFLTRNGMEVLTAPIPSKQTAATPDTTPPKSGAEQTGPYSKALGLLRLRMAALDLPKDTKADPPVQIVLTHCAAVSEELVDLASADLSTDPAYAAWCDDIFTAADKITLMSMEETLAAAADAVGILAQISRDLEAQLVQ